MSRQYTQSQIAECSQDDDGNIIDPITLEPIEPNRIISIKEGQTYYCFDIDTIYQEISAGRKKNPYTRVDLSNEILDQVNKYGETLQVTVEPLWQQRLAYYDDGTRIGTLGTILLSETDRPVNIYLNGAYLASYDLMETIGTLGNRRPNKLRLNRY